MAFFSLKPSASCLKKAVLVSGLLLTSAQGHADPGSEGPFLGLSGHWSGAGTVTMTNGVTERIRCKATYAVNATGKAVQQTLRCASDSYRVEISSNWDSPDDSRIGVNISPASLEDRRDVPAPRSCSTSKALSPIRRIFASGSIVFSDLASTALCIAKIHRKSQSQARREDVGYGGFWKMRSMEFNVLVGIFVLVVVTLIGLSIAGAPKYPAGYPADRMTSSQ
jgi:hypothetical protein